MADAVREMGGKVRLNSPVREMLHQGKKLTGVVLENGERLEADAVVVNADYAHAMQTLFGHKNQPAERLKRKKFSCSTFMMYLGVDKLYPDEPHHHILFADDYQKNVTDIQSQKNLSEDVSIYVRNSSRTDPHVAPAGHSALYILVPTINMRYDTDWGTQAAKYREIVLQRLESRTGMSDLRKHIVAEKILTPQQWITDYSVFMGATFNLAHTLDQMLYLRPHNRLQGWQNGYLVGGGTHPGSGLPTIYESARISANLICEQFGVPYQCTDFATQAIHGAWEPEVAPSHVQPLPEGLLT
jgi:phytoene desaturase